MSHPGRLGAWVEGERTHFRVWAPKAATVEAVVEAGGQRLEVPLDSAEGGYFEGSSDQVHAGGLYRYRLDCGASYPDPASRCQPEGVHGPSEVIDPTRFPWSVEDVQVWRGPDRDRMVIYELHVGSFTTGGTYDGVREHLSDLAELGVTVIELLPLNDFDGRWNWGYDGAALFAPARCYGRPDQLRALVDAAHQLGLAVILDVVYNHLGPAGNYTGQFSDDYVRPDKLTAWGPAINLGGRNSEHVRAFFLANARHWVEEYHFDGFRVDATHAFVDDGPRPFLAEFAETVRAATDCGLILIAEDHRNLNTIIQPKTQGGWDFDGVWADDFHHILRRYLTGDRDGVFQDFEGTVAELATTIDRGWLKTGEYSNYRRKHRGTDPGGIPAERFVFCLQNHDRVGNRGKGDRLHHAVDAATDRAATAALLLAPETPMLFMGQEWAASTPFFYFTDHAPELGAAIQAGRAREFQLYDDFNTPAKLAAVPDPQAEATFRRSQLDWSERNGEPHAATLRLHRALLGFRRDQVADGSKVCSIRANQVGPDTLAVSFGRSPSEPDLIAVVHLRGAARIDFDTHLSRDEPPKVVLDTEAALFAAEGSVPIRLEANGEVWSIHFERPGAVIVSGLLGMDGHLASGPDSGTVS